MKSLQVLDAACEEVGLGTRPLAEVAVIVLNWNGLDDTIECVHSLLEQDYPDFHIFVVDNGSFVDPEAAIGKSPRTTLIKTGDNYGFCRGNNIAIEVAWRLHYKYCWILNNDTVVDPDALSTLVGFLKNHPECNAVTNRINYANDRNSCWFAGGTIRAGVPSHRLIASGQLSENTNMAVTDFLSGCSFLAKTEVLIRLGGFDENYFCYMEDIDLSIRIKALGGELGYSEEAVVHHKVSRSTGHHSPLKVYYKTRNFIYYWKKFSLGSSVLLSHFVRSARLVLVLLIKNHDIRAAVCLLRGVFDGLIGRTGRCE